MEVTDKADFSGYATKAGLECSDGRTITPQAFQHMHGLQVPLVWQHGHNSPDNVLGHAVLEARNDGVYAYGFFNDTPAGKNAKLLVQHKDVNQLSIYANALVEKMKKVLHGVICEVSLVLKGANPGARIDYVSLAHADGGYTELEDEAVIFTGLELEHGGLDDEELEHATVREIYDTMTEEQQNVLHYMIGVALEQAGSTASHSDEGTTEEDDEEDDEETAEDDAAEDDNTPSEGDLNHQEGSTTVTRNVFEQNDKTAGGGDKTLSHDDMKGIFAKAVKMGSLRHAVEDYALSHGIDDIDVLFPNAKNLTDTPEFIKRRTEWVAGVLNGVASTPFSRVKSLFADITQDEARAKGYIKGTLKKEEFFGVTKRTTGPTTVYKKQKLDRDDILDITDFDVVVWMKGEMRLMLEEEIARAILIGDGREADDDDKIKDPVGATDGTGIRSILNDHEMFVTTVNVNIDDSNSSYNEVVEELMRARRFYKGTGQPSFYTTNAVAVNMLLSKDTLGRRLYNSMQELATALNVAKIVEVEAMEDEVNNNNLLGILVNLQDYNVGTDRGGEVNMFDFFDIDYNQYKYLTETRMSGALVKYKAALVIKKVASGAALVVPASPTQDDDEVTIVNTTGVTYKIESFDGTVTYNGSGVSANQTVTASFPIVLAAGASVTVIASPASGSYYFESNAEDEWTFDN